MRKKSDTVQPIKVSLTDKFSQYTSFLDLPTWEEESLGLNIYVCRNQGH